MDIGVEALREATEEAVECFARLLPQLSSSAPSLTRASLEKIIACPTNTVLAARGDGRLVGALTLVMIPIPTGVRAWIEDVVVDTDMRGVGIGAALTSEAVRIGSGGRRPDSRPDVAPVAGVGDPTVRTGRLRPAGHQCLPIHCWIVISAVSQGFC
ncbi:GNAT family N-acetyltransferase [Actinopolymorpha sp. B17G11]|uniref:GNAT family N-acetyltransferase n=1 Tax=Actinopolymorpha sp. B17G11 TaxID=3160861 RepID=UPI0032E4F014